MSSNRHKPHLLILPEDEADSDIANGFQNHPCVFERNLQILPWAGGWRHVVEHLSSVLALDMRNYNHRLVLLLIDFDGKENRLEFIRGEIPDDLRERVFIVGSRTNPQELKSDLNCDLEQIGYLLAEDCRTNSTATWNTSLLSNNLDEVARLNKSVRPFLIKP